jgi:opacity protein-like surface antigen
MKKLFASLVLTLAACTPCTASEPYLEGFFGLNHIKPYGDNDLKLSLNTGYVVGAAGGYRFCDFFRLEEEVSFRSNSFDRITSDTYSVNLGGEGTFRSISVMSNSVFEFPFMEGNTPYLGCGIGANFGMQDIQLYPLYVDGKHYPVGKFNEKSCDLSYQIIAGHKFSIGNKCSTSIDYRYMNCCDFNGNHSVCMNVERKF